MKKETKQLELDLDQSTPKKKMTYSLGSADPRTRCGHTSFSGVDVKVYLVDVDTDYKKAVMVGGTPSYEYVGQAGNIQGVHFVQRNGMPEGTIHMIIFDGMEEIEKYLGKKQRLVLSAANEYGKLAILADKNIQFDPYCSWGVGIDNLVIDVYVNFIELKDNRRCKE